MKKARLILDFQSISLLPTHPEDPNVLHFVDSVDIREGNWIFPLVHDSVHSWGNSVLWTAVDKSKPP